MVADTLSDKAKITTEYKKVLGSQKFIYKNKRYFFSL